jgi:hypothetical protein
MTFLSNSWNHYDSLVKKNFRQIFHFAEQKAYTIFKIIQLEIKENVSPKIIISNSRQLVLMCQIQLPIIKKPA